MVRKIYIAFNNLVACRDWRVFADKDETYRMRRWTGERYEVREAETPEDLEEVELEHDMWCFK